MSEPVPAAAQVGQLVVLGLPEVLLEELPPPPPPPQPFVNGSGNGTATSPAKEEEEEEEEALPIKPPVNPKPPTAQPELQPEPVPTFDEFQRAYPGEVDPPSKPEFVKLKPAGKVACVRSLAKYRECERWKKTPQFIPRASRFIREEFWKFEPPPLLSKQSTQSGKLAPAEEVLQYMRRPKSWES